MINLGLAVASSALISITMRASEKYVKNEMGMFMANYAVCMLLSFFYLQDYTQLLEFRTPDGRLSIALGVLTGVLYLANFLFLKFNMKLNGVVMSSTFMKLGVLVPTVMAILVFHESPHVTQLIGILAAVIAILLVNFEKSAISEGKHRVWLVFLLLLSGFTDSMVNVFEKMGQGSLKDVYLLMTFATAFVITLVLGLKTGEKITGKELLFGSLIGVPNYFSSRFLLLALTDLDAVLVYPAYSVATIVVITLAGIFVFREKLSRKKGVALGFILLALGLLNI